MTFKALKLRIGLPKVIGTLKDYTSISGTSEALPLSPTRTAVLSQGELLQLLSKVPAC